jgi:hypothetical protein
MYMPDPVCINHSDGPRPAVSGVHFDLPRVCQLPNQDHRSRISQRLRLDDILAARAALSTASAPAPLTIEWDGTDRAPRW